MNNITALIATIKSAAEKAQQGKWNYEAGAIWRTDESGWVQHMAAVDTGDEVSDEEHKNNMQFITTATPANVRTLVEALEKAQQAANINNQWKPDVCPITGRKFFMWIEHPELGYVPTYGGPLDSYTIPTRDSDGEFSCERYDHDFGGWVDGECVGVHLIDDDEQCRVYELEQSIAELREQLRTVELSNSVLESRTVTVKLPSRIDNIDLRSPLEVEDMWIHIFKAELAAAGIQVIEGDA